MPVLNSHRPGWLLALPAILWLSGCGSVDLGPRYESPPIRMPEPVSPQPAAPAPVPLGAPVAQPQPIPAPAQPVARPLPPVVTAPSAPAQVNLVTLTARLDGASVIPPARSGATGQIDAVYDSTNRVLRWKASWTGLMGLITSVQFHGPADPAQNAAATLLWPGPFGPTYEGKATLTPQQAGDLVSGRWYMSVSTSSYALGELRGQLRVVH